MKKVLPVFVLIIVALTAKSQIRPCDSLYLWVDFREDKILISIPEQYTNYRTQWPALPSHVRVNEVLMLVPDLPVKEMLLSILTDGLNSNDRPSDHNDQLKYLSQMVLLLFYSNNNLSYFADQYTTELSLLTEKSSVTKEAVLVNKWVEMIRDK